MGPKPRDPTWDASEAKLVALRAAALRGRATDPSHLEITSYLQQAGGRLAVRQAPTERGPRLKGTLDTAWRHAAGVRCLGGDEYATLLRRWLRKASSRIWVAQFLIDVRPHEDRYGEIRGLLDLLVSAAAKGLDVRVLLSSVAPPDGPSYDVNWPALQYLALRGVSVRTHAGTAERPFSHLKLAIVDEAVVVGNTNWTARGFHLNEDANVASDTGLGQPAASWFMASWERSKARPKAPPAKGLLRRAPPALPEVGVPTASGSGVARLCAGQRYVHQLTDALAASSRRVFVAVYGLHLAETPRLRRLWEALLAAQRRGADVRVLADTDPDAISPRDLSGLAAAGVGVRRWPLRSRLHARCVVVDDTTFVGSVGLTPSSLFRTSELAVVIQATSVANDQAARFQRWWDMAGTPRVAWPIAWMTGWPSSVNSALDEAGVANLGALLSVPVVRGLNDEHLTFVKRAATVVIRDGVPPGLAWVRARGPDDTRGWDARTLDGVLRPRRPKLRADLAPAGSFFARLGGVR